MSRTIKFRVWDRERQKWADFFQIDLISPSVNPQYTLQQYTGLKDKNGKEIYEGDILKPFVGNFAPQKVFFHDGQWVMGGDVMCLKLGESNSGQFEIIGNVHENGDSI